MPTSFPAHATKLRHDGQWLGHTAILADQTALPNVRAPHHSLIAGGHDNDPICGNRSQVSLRWARFHDCAEFECSPRCAPATRTPLKTPWHGLLRALVQEWTNMNCTVTSAKNFSGQSGIISRIYPVQSAVSVRKSIPDRPFIFPILQLFQASVQYISIRHASNNLYRNIVSNFFITQTGVISGQMYKV